MSRSKRGHPTEAQREALLIIEHAVLNRLPNAVHHIGGYGFERRVRSHVAEEERRLWALGQFPLRWGKGWIAGLTVYITDTTASVGAGMTCGPAKPCRPKPGWCRVTAKSTWNV